MREVVSKNGWSQAEILEMATAAELHSNHPIALSILKAFSETGRQLDEPKISNHKNYSGQGVSVEYGQYSLLVGNDRILQANSIPHPDSEFDTTVAHVVIDGIYGGFITIGDELKSDSKEAIGQLRKLGINHISMLTGDLKKAADSIAKKLGLDNYHAGLLPEDKVDKFEELTREIAGTAKTVFVGDGINDALVLARSDVGVAMGGLGSDAAIESADVVLMTDSPLKLRRQSPLPRKPGASSGRI